MLVLVLAIELKAELNEKLVKGDVLWIRNKPLEVTTWKVLVNVAESVDDAVHLSDVPVKVVTTVPMMEATELPWSSRHLAKELAWSHEIVTSWCTPHIQRLGPQGWWKLIDLYL